MISGLESGYISIFGIKNRKVIRRRISQYDYINSVVINKDCTKLFSASVDNTIAINDIVSG